MDWKFKKDVPQQGSSDGFWYDITDGGRIDPAEVLDSEEQIKKVKEALELLQDFEKALEHEGITDEEI